MNRDDVEGVEARADVDDMESYRDVWGFIRTIAFGWPEKTAPLHVWEIHIAAVRSVAKTMLEVHAEDEQRAHAFRIGHVETAPSGMNYPVVVMPENKDE